MASTLALLQLVKPLVQDKVAWYTWQREQTERANKVALCRDYADGEHRASLTEEMRNMLRVKTAELGSPFNLNHMDNIIQSVIDRLELTAIEADKPEATTWFQDKLTDNRIDGLQLDVHEAALRDADSYIMVSFDNETGDVVLTQEDAFDGTCGIIMVYGPDKRTPLLALKLWQEAKPAPKRAAQFITRVNAYYPDRVEKYQSGERGGALMRMEENPEKEGKWVMPDGTAIGIPIIHYRNRSAKNRQGGKSEISDVIPLQDALNRTMVSMVMAAELTAFQIRYSIGMKPPAALSPGMWINAYVKDEAGETKPPSDAQQKWLDSIRFGTLAQGELIPFLEQAKFKIDQMYLITRTPKPGDAGDTSSGEALKQREIGLVGKAKRCHVNFGNAWENVARIMWRVQAAYGTEQPPEYKKLYAKWRSAELRDDVKVIDNANKVAEKIDQKTYLKLVAPVFGWDDDAIDKIIDALRGDSGARMAALAGNIPAFGGGVLNGIPVGSAA